MGVAIERRLGLDAIRQLVSSMADPRDVERARRQSMATLERLADFTPRENDGDLHYSEPRQAWTLPQPEPPKRQRHTRTASVAEPPDWSAWNAWCDQRIAAAVARERAEMIPIIGEAIGKLLDVEADRHKSELSEKISELRLEVAKLHTVLAEVRIGSAAEAARGVLDLRARNVN
jgi:hypothetical protein